MRQSLNLKETLHKFLSVAVVATLVVSLLPSITIVSEVQAEETQVAVEEAELKSEEEILDSVDGTPVSSDEIAERALNGGKYSLFDRSNVEYSVKDTDSSISGMNRLKATELPTSVDLRNFNGQNRVTSIKNQSSTGTCWSFAANAVSETNIATSKGQAATTDYAPFQTAYFAYDALSTDTSKLKGSEISQKGEGIVWASDDMKRNYALNVGGTTFQASSELIQGVGPTTATSIPFPTSSLDDGKMTTTLSSEQRRQSVARLSKWSMLGSLATTKYTYDSDGNLTSYVYDSTNETVLNRIKSELAEGKAVEISYWAGQSYTWQPSFSTYYNSKNACQYTVDPGIHLTANHAVTVVGYDDSYSKTNFNSSYQPPENGAFIVKNSWGTSWGKSGYFYLSYWDQSVTDATVYEYDTTNYDGNIMDASKEVVDQYDYTSAEDVLEVGVQAETEVAQWYSNIYTASWNQKLHSIGTYYCSEGKTLNYKVYKLKNNATSPFDVAGSLDSPDAQGTYTNDYKGFATIKLTSPVDLKKGEKYAIMFSQKNEEGYYCAPQSMNLEEGVSEGTKFWDVNTVVNSGESFYLPEGSSTWKTMSNTKVWSDAYGTNLVFDNYCVKGYATVQPYKVTFMASGFEYANREAYEGETVSGPSRNPEKTGYDFVDWYKDENFNTPWLSSDPVTEDMTIYAKFNPKVYYVWFYDGYTTLTSQQIEYNNYATEPDPAPTRDGFKFDGWYTKDGSDTGDWGEKFVFTENRITGLTELYAKWVHSVTFVDWNGTILNTQNVDTGGSATAPASPTRTGYTFTGWDKDFTNVTSNMTVTAQYKINTYTVTFNTNGGTSVVAKTVNYGSKVAKPTPDPTKVGYTFAGWYTDSTLKTAYNFDAQVTKSFTLYAKWTQNVTMWRLYNPNSSEHFYTANTDEKNYLVTVGWRDEGKGWTAPATSNVPVYRLYNPNGGDHHYTMSTSERDYLIKIGWRDEKIGWYSDPNKGVSLYRQYNPNAKSGSHNYTTSKSENDWLVSLGWREEGVGWYGV